MPGLRRERGSAPCYSWGPGETLVPQAERPALPCFLGRGELSHPRVLKRKQPQAGVVTLGSSQAEIPSSGPGRRCGPQFSQNRPRSCPHLQQEPTLPRASHNHPDTQVFSRLSSLSVLLELGIPGTKHLCRTGFLPMIGGHTQYQSDNLKPSEQGRIPAPIQQPYNSEGRHLSAGLEGTSENRRQLQGPEKNNDNPQK